MSSFISRVQCIVTRRSVAKPSSVGRFPCLWHDLSRLMMVGNVSNVGNVTTAHSQSQATLPIGLIHSLAQSFYLFPVKLYTCRSTELFCLCFSPPGWELGSGKILFDVGADCLLMSDAGDRSRVSSMGSYSFFFPNLSYYPRYASLDKNCWKVVQLFKFILLIINIYFLWKMPL